MLVIVLSSSGSLHAAPLKVCFVAPICDRQIRCVDVDGPGQTLPFGGVQFAFGEGAEADWAFFDFEFGDFPGAPTFGGQGRMDFARHAVAGGRFEYFAAVHCEFDEFGDVRPVWSFHTVARARAGTASTTTAAIAPASSSRLLLFISPIPFRDDWSPPLRFVSQAAFRQGEDYSQIFWIKIQRPGSKISRTSAPRRNGSSSNITGTEAVSEAAPTGMKVTAHR